MTKILANQKLFAVLTALFLLASFFLVLFHHHEDGTQHSDCPVCRLVQQMASVFVAILIAFIGNFSASRRFASVFSERFTSRLLASRLLGRAPPLLSQI